MAKNKSSEIKKYLSSEKNNNERAPVWVYLKTKTRDWIQGRTRNWRADNLGKKIKHKQKASGKYRKKTNLVRKPKVKKAKNKKH